MAREKTTGFYFKMSPEESALFERNMARSGIKNKSAFIRKMCIDGYVLNLDIPALDEIGRLIRITANNVNQFTRRVNSGGEAYRRDVAEIGDQFTEIRACFGEVLESLSDLGGAKPGKRLTTPLSAVDAKHTDPAALDKGA